MWRGPSYPGEFPTLGPQVADFIEHYCVIPDGDLVGQPFLLTDEQYRFLLWHYRLDPDTGKFVYRRSQLVRPQKWGKGPISAAIICAECEGPVVPDGWDAAGEPVGRPWTTPWVQVTAVSEDQTQNVWRCLQPMIELGPLANLIPDTGETRINLRGGGRVEPVTASARSRLGQRITLSVQDEALALDTPLPTPTGWTSMEKVQAGDHLIGADGQSVRVLAATDVQHGRQCYEVTFTDGTSIVASDGHLWRARRWHGKQSFVWTTGEMHALPGRFHVPAPRPYQTPEADLPVDPYFLGLWLGDGSTGQAYITAGVEDVDAVRAELARCGVETHVSYPEGRAARIGFSNTNGYQGQGRPHAAKALQSLACYRGKHIPEVYFRASERQRLALLQGLMDSDGHAGQNGYCTFAGNDQLSGDVLALLRTLGQVARRVWHEDPRSRVGGGWKVNFTPRLGLVPFRLPRKVERVRGPGRDEGWVTIVSIKPVGSVPVRCVMVDSDDHLFLAGEAGHVTHNTHSWLEVNGGYRLADNQRRNLAGMSGRAIETTNAWDPAEISVAQMTAESPSKDIYRDHLIGPPASLGNKRERRKALKVVYGDSFWVDLDRIDAEIEELADRDPVQAERFFLNRIVATADAWLDGNLWDSRADRERVIKPRADHKPRIVLGFDGSQYDDWTGFRAETLDGFQFTPRYGADKRPALWDPSDFGGEVPRSEVNTAMHELMTTFDVVRAYCDPPFWQSEIDAWAAEYGDKVVLGWETRRDLQMHAALERLATDIVSGDLHHDGCIITAIHIRNAKKDRRRNGLVCIRKDRPGSPRKIDAAVMSALAHEAAGDCIADGLAKKKNYFAYTA